MGTVKTLLVEIEKNEKNEKNEKSGG